MATIVTVLSLVALSCTISGLLLWRLLAFLRLPTTSDEFTFDVVAVLVVGIAGKVETDMGLKVVGTALVGTVVVGAAVVGSEVVGSSVVGTEVVGTAVVGIAVV